MDKRKPVILPEAMLAAINRHDYLEGVVDGTKIFSIAHHKGDSTESEPRYCVYIHNTAWPMYIWDLHSKVWYYNTVSHSALANLEHLVGEKIGVVAMQMKAIADRGVVGAVKQRIKEASGGT